MVNASPVLVWSFVGLAVLVAAGFIVAVHRAAVATAHPHPRRLTIVTGVATAAWLALTAGLAASGVMSFTSRPPTMLVLVPVIFALGIGLAGSNLGRRLATGLPLDVLVGSQAFRLPLELTMHRAYIEGLMPVQMSYSGRNFDILTGISAIVVLGVLVRRPKALWLVRLWNVGGLLLLANILTVALLSAPTPFRAFHNEPANVWITHAPWVWLPAVFVLAAIMGHIVVFRRLLHEAKAQTVTGHGWP
ncbi:MAG TPA: hypothetical protein VFZ21_06210 [Gemmatimonadaceae bacterium]|jgi:hypothetical protein|nr:hypothetical protein [Gemmatimonadaceae bacterium]